MALDLNLREDLLDSALSIIDQLGGEVAAVKVNYHLLLPLALKDIALIVDAAHQKGLQTIADLKLNDIYSTNLAVLEILHRAGFDALIVNPIVGYRDALQPTIEAAHKKAMGVIFLTYMSHKGAPEGYGLKLRLSPSSVKPLYKLFAERALKWGADGLIVGATRPTVIKEVAALTNNSLPIFSPGVGAQGGSALDALKAGANFLIIGRSIIDASNRLEEAKKLKEWSWSVH